MRAPLEKVTEAFAFVAQHAEFTDTILFADDEVEELTVTERNALKVVLQHVEHCYVDLLSKCRAVLIDRAKSEADGLAQTMRRNFNSDRSLWDRGYADIPVVIQASYVESVNFKLETVYENDTKNARLALVAGLWIQTRKRHILEGVASARNRQLTKGLLLFPSKPLTEGTTFESLATDLVDDLWPFMVDVRAQLEQHKGATVTASDHD